MIEQFLEKFENLNKENLHLYFITRVLKPNVKKRAKILDKYNFEIYQVDIDKEIRLHLFDISIKQLKYIDKKQLETTEYEAITDDIRQIFTYDASNKAMSFLDIVKNKLENKSKIPKVNNLTEIVNSQELWAYSVGFYDNDDWIYSFRKILKGKVAVDENTAKSKKIFGTFRTKFNTVSNKLEILKGETINLDERIDCMYFNETFYIFQKTQFEQITGLTEEFKEHAETIADELIATNMFDGMDLLKKQIEENPAIHKKLVRLKKINNYQNLTEKSLKKMIKIAKRYGGTLKENKGKIVIENENDIDLTIKVLW